MLDACTDDTAANEKQLDARFGIQNALWPTVLEGSEIARKEERIKLMKRTTSDDLRQPGLAHEISSECERIRAGWTGNERQRRAGLATVRQYALWESIMHSPFVVAIDRRSLATCRG